LTKNILEKSFQLICTRDIVIKWQFKLLFLFQIAKQDTKKERKHLKEVKHQAESKSWTPKATKDVVSLVLFRLNL
jgi:hypothetical protein